ncbi:MAG TPA: FAD-dependent oxidoreductase, partial [Miltoncostaea sp.]|nr:FAD-dependent oxidoreductase [Miltoncostaea sp.]
METAGTLIVGAGLAGSAVAMHLAEMGHDGVVVVDPDLAGVRSSSELNAGGVRATWWQPVNVELCAATIDWFAERPEEFGLRQRGYLWLHGPDRFAAAAERVTMQNGFGRDIELLSPQEVHDRWPIIDEVSDLGGATFSPRDGLVNPNAVREHYRERARAGGVRFVDRTVVTGVRRDGDRVAHVEVRDVEDGDEAVHVLEGERPHGDRDAIACERVVNAAGPWAVQVAELLGVPVPCRAVPRQICVMASHDVDMSDHGMIV